MSNNHQHLPGNHPALDNPRHRMRLMAIRIRTMVSMGLPVNVYSIVDEMTVVNNDKSYKVICSNLADPELKGLYRFDAGLQCYVIGINLDKLSEAERRFYVALGLGMVVTGALPMDGQHAVPVKGFSTLLDVLNPENPGSYLLMDFACELIAPEMDFLFLKSLGHPYPAIGKIMDVPIEVIQYMRDQQAH